MSNKQRGSKMKVTINGSIETDIACSGMTFVEWLEAKRLAVFSAIAQALPESFKGDGESFASKMVNAVLRETDSSYEVTLEPIGENPLAKVNTENARKSLIKQINENFDGLTAE